MATAVGGCLGRSLLSYLSWSPCNATRCLPVIARSHRPNHHYHQLHSSTRSPPTSLPRDIAFVFDIDGVILRSSKPVGNSPAALKRLQAAQVPFLFLTNGGGTHEADRVAGIQSKLGLSGLDHNHIVMSHSPFRLLKHLFDKNVLVIGPPKCRKIANSYGFKHAYSPSDLWVSKQDLWPFSRPFEQYHQNIAVQGYKGHAPKIDAIFVFNDPRDWGLDMTVVVDLLLSKGGQIGTKSDKNGDTALPNNGYQQDGQPPLYFSNPDLWWANSYSQPRLGQGAFREALVGVWAAITGGEANGVTLQKEVIGKPYKATYDFAEQQLIRNLEMVAGGVEVPPLRKVYMVGDNPESDIKGANDFRSTRGTDWVSVLVETGVFDGGEPAHKPRVIVEDVEAAVAWALKDAQQDQITK